LWKDPSENELIALEELDSFTIQIIFVLILHIPPLFLELIRAEEDLRFHQFLKILVLSLDQFGMRASAEGNQLLLG